MIKRGLRLIESLLVMVIYAILAKITVPNSRHTDHDPDPPA